MFRVDETGQRLAFARPTPKTCAVFAAGLFFFCMAASGLVLFAQPRAMLGSRLTYSFLGVDAAAWTRIHIVSAVLFVAAGFWHIALHTTVIRTILFGVRGHHRGHWPEAAVVIVIAVLFLATAAVDVPPARWIIEFQLDLGRAVGRQ